MSTNKNPDIEKNLQASGDLLSGITNRSVPLNVAVQTCVQVLILMQVVLCDMYFKSVITDLKIEGK